MRAMFLALRPLLRRRSLTAMLLAILAIAITALALTSAVADHFLLRPIPFPEADRLVAIQEADRKTPGEEKRVSPADFHDVSDLDVFRSSAAWMNWSFTVTGSETPRRVAGALVTDGFFATLGTLPAAGRLLEPSDAVPGAAEVVVISHRLWRERFGSDPALIDSHIMIGGDPVKVVGIMPSTFRFPDEEIEIWTPLIFGVHFEPDDRGGRNLRMVARLDEGADLATARSSLAFLSSRLESSFPETHQGWSLAAEPLQESLVRHLRPTILLFVIASAALLAIAIANCANLLLMLAVSRRREIATRVAMGAGAGSILRGIAAQALLLALMAAGISIAATALILPLIERLGFELPFPIELRLDARLIVFCSALSLFAALAASIPAAIDLVRTRFSSTLRPSDHTTRSGRPLRRALVIAQVAMASALVIAGFLLGESFAKLLSVDPGFDSRNLVTGRVWLSGSYGSSAEQALFFDEGLRRIAAIPGVASAAAIQDLPIRGNVMGFEVAAEGTEEPLEAAWRIVTPGYFETMRMPMFRGRSFVPEDGPDAPRVAVVNRRLAVRLFGPRDPIGLRIRVGEDGSWATVVGVAGDVRHRGLSEEEVPAVYEPLAQKERDFLRWMTFTIRTAAAPSPGIVDAIRREVAAIDPSQAVYEIATMDELLGRETAPARIATILVGSLGGSALLIALTGLAGAVSYGVTLRRRELGIRAAIGATPAALQRSVLREALLLAGIGALAGLAFTAWGFPLMEHLLFRAGAPSFGSIFFAMVLVTILSAAGAIPPARMAARLDPAAVLRSE